SVADATKSASAIVSLMPPVTVTVTVSPQSATLSAGQNQQFAAGVAGTSNTAVTWTSSPPGIGSISAGGLYTAPATIAAAPTITVTATSVADATKSASAIVSLMPPVTVTVSPQSATLSAGQNQQFAAGVA